MLRALLQNVFEGAYPQLIHTLDVPDARLTTTLSELPGELVRRITIITNNRRKGMPLASRWAVVVAALVAALGFLWIGLTGLRVDASVGKETENRTPVEGVTLTQFTIPPAAGHEAAWSPDGKWIAFGSTRSGNEDIWIKPVGGGEAIQITNNPATDGYPAWSLDGTKLAFISNRGGAVNVWTIPSFGGEASRITSDEDSVCAVFESGSRVSWSPDGKWIAFVSQKGGYMNIRVIPSTSGTARQITDDPANAVFPSWSPDGKRIAFTSDRGSRSLHIWTVPVSGGMARPITRGQWLDWMPSWSPDGKWIAFSSSRKGNMDIWVIPSTGGVAIQITDTREYHEFAPKWSPDGKRIAFNAHTSLGELWVMPASGGKPTRLADRVVDESPSWSPDGKHIAFIAPNDEGQDVWRMPASGGHRTRVTEGGMVDAGGAGVSWSPDGEKIAFIAGANLCAVPASGGALRWIELISGKRVYSLCSWMSWSPDGRMLVFSALTDGTWDLWVGSDSGRERLVDWPSAEWAPDWSPDGGKIAFTSNRMKSGEIGGWSERVWEVSCSVWVIGASFPRPASGGKAIWLVEGAQPDWSPDGIEVLFMREGDIWTVPASGGTPTRILETPENESWPKWAPDGSRILFVRSVGVGIWIADVSGMEILR